MAMAKLLLALLLLLVDWRSIIIRIIVGIIGVFEGIIGAFEGIIGSILEHCGIE